MEEHVSSLCSFIASHRDDLVSLCVQRMQRAGHVRSVEELVADYDVILAEMVRALQSSAGLSDESLPEGITVAASRHGSQRQLSGYNIRQIALDFGTISDSVGGWPPARG
jgi:hypothetical protein